MYMMRNEINWLDLEKCTGRGGALTLEEVQKPAKQLLDQKNKKHAKYFAPAEEPETTLNVQRICFGREKSVC